MFMKEIKNTTFNISAFIHLLDFPQVSREKVSVIIHIFWYICVIELVFCEEGEPSGQEPLAVPLLEGFPQIHMANYQPEWLPWEKVRTDFLM